MCFVGQCERKHSAWFWPDVTLTHGQTGQYQWYALEPAAHLPTHDARTIKLKAQQGEAPHAGDSLQFAFPWSFSALYAYTPAVWAILSSPGCLPTCPWLLCRTGSKSSPNTHSSRSAQTRPVLGPAGSAEAPLCLTLQQDKFTQAINQEVQFLNGVQQRSCRHQKEFTHLYSCWWKSYIDQSLKFIAYSAITSG